MDVNDSTGTSGPLKRQREPFSDIEENVPISEGKDEQKRRRLESSSQENWSPKPSSLGRSLEMEIKPDTPAIPSVRQLIQRREGMPPLAQRFLSDPGYQLPSFALLTGREELQATGSHHSVPRPSNCPRNRSSLQEDCEAGTSQVNDGSFTAVAVPDGVEDGSLDHTGRKDQSVSRPSNSCPRNRSSLVIDMHQKLQSSVTPSSKQAFRIRQEREEELRLLRSQPISDNAWLKRSYSDSSLAKEDCKAGTSQVNDGSFTAVAVPDGVEDGSLDHTDFSSPDETHTAEMIDQMFEEVLEMATDGCQEDHDSGIAAGSTEKDAREPLAEEEERSEEESEGEAERRDVDTSGDELTFPPSGILSPLGKSVEAVVTPMRLAASQLSNPASLLLTPREQAAPPPDAAPLYSIDAYRTQSQSAKPDIVVVTPGVQRQNPEKTQTKPSINTKDRILALNEEAGKLQTVISQTLQALGCCTDEVHGRGSLEEAEAEKLLLVSCEKRTALLAEVARLKQSSPEASRAGGGDVDSITQVPCRGTVGISSVQLPLKVEFVCSARNRPGRPSHFFLVLIRYGACDIVATPLATAADAMNGDTISFPTSITLKDIRSNFEIDVEVYSLSHTSGNACTVERSTAKSRVTPRKLLNTFSKSIHSGPSSGLPTRSTRRSSNFSLVGSHKITLDSLGQNKFPLDKIKFEGKIRNPARSPLDNR
ncbi:anillin [Hypomesus transpacificus]|uniref:anillin n=1 Tax=Hypomesus transpacificus TaxID=137520 RepID=UPI001F074B7A|nr:anillin [Hypomesus transpacificus]